MDAGPVGYHELVNVERRRLLVAALELHHGHRTNAARYLGLSRPYLLRLLKQLGIAASVRERWPIGGHSCRRKN